MALGDTTGLRRVNVGGRSSGGVGFTVSISGRRDIERMLKKVIPAAADRSLRVALNKGATITLRMMRQTVPVQKARKHGFRSGVALPRSRKDRPRGGRLKRSLGRKYIHYKSSGNHLLMLGPRVKAPHQGKHGHLVEAGTGPRWQTSTGRYTGRMPALRFMERAMDATRFAAERVIASSFAQRLRVEIRRQRRR